MYSPSIGRFLTRDTWSGDYGDPHTLNAWIYTSSNPVNYTDPSGYFAVACDQFTATNWPPCYKIVFEPLYPGGPTFIRFVPCDEQKEQQFPIFATPTVTPRPATPTPDSIYITPSPNQTQVQVTTTPTITPSPTPTQELGAVYQFNERSGGFKNGPSATDFDGVSVALSAICHTPSDCLQQMFNRPPIATDFYRKTTMAILIGSGFIVTPTPPPLPHASVTHLNQTYRPNGSPQWSNTLKSLFATVFGPPQPVLH